MSKIAFKPNISGAGTLTIEAPASAANRTLTLPDETGTLLTKGLGINQAWQDVKTSRALSTTYTNNTGKPILVSITSFATVNGSASINVGGVIISTVTTLASAATLSSFVVPDGTTYSITQTETGAVIWTWSELR